MLDSITCDFWWCWDVKGFLVKWTPQCLPNGCHFVPSVNELVDNINIWANSHMYDKIVLNYVKMGKKLIIMTDMRILVALLVGLWWMHIVN